MNTYWISPSILSADFACLGAEVDAVLEAGADTIHFDVMDNHYVPNMTFGPMVCKALRQYGVTATIDVHLMVEPVDRLIEGFLEAGADFISFHPEATRHVDRSLQAIKEGGAKAGLALNPATSLDCLEYTLEFLDLVLVMSVNPGFGGQQFLPAVLPKIEAIRARIDDLGLRTRLQVDGGINLETLACVAQAGADTFVSGSAIFGSDDYQQTLSNMRQLLEASAP